jgi:pentatricopeptide repeat protein
MCEEGVQPDDITFACLLSACSHAGLVDEGMHYYASKITDYMISIKLEHYTCIINLAILAIYKRQTILSKQCPIDQMWVHGWFC